jgi:Phosphodiester glycosidase
MLIPIIQKFMQQFWLAGTGSLTLGWTLVSTLACSNQPPAPMAAPLTPPPGLQYEVRSQPQAKIHIVTLPIGAPFTLTAASPSGLATVEQQVGTATAALNAGFFDPTNQQTTAHVVIQGKIAADPQQNAHLTQNPKLQPYLQKIFNRSEWRRYGCKKTAQSEAEPRYAIVPHSDPPPSGCQLMDAVGGGPQLLPNVQASAEAEAFWDPASGRDPIGIYQPNARSAIGLKADGTVLLVMVAQTTPQGGLSLPALAALMAELGAIQALNLDGGTSSALVYEGKSYLGKLDREGMPMVSDRPEVIGRPVKSVLLVQPAAP